MAFQTENNLVSSFKENIETMFSLQNTPSVLQEVKLGFGIPDVIISERVKKSKQTHGGFLTTSDIAIYRIIEKCKKTTIDNISNKTKCSKSQINKSLTKLIKRALVEHIDMYFVLSSKYELSYKTSIAIEAKLKNWKRALMQAYRYKWFADYAYVVLDHAHIRPAIQNIRLFKEYNIGLISMSSDGFFEKHYIPHKEKPIDTKMQILLSETLLINELDCKEG